MNTTENVAFETKFKNVLLHRKIMSRSSNIQFFLYFKPFDQL